MNTMYGPRCILLKDLGPNWSKTGSLDLCIHVFLHVYIGLNSDLHILHCFGGSVITEVPSMLSDEPRRASVKKQTKLAFT